MLILFGVGWQGPLVEQEHACWQCQQRLYQKNWTPSVLMWSESWLRRLWVLNKTNVPIRREIIWLFQPAQTWLNDALQGHECHSIILTKNVEEKIVREKWVWNLVTTILAQACGSGNDINVATWWGFCCSCGSQAARSQYKWFTWVSKWVKWKLKNICCWQVVFVLPFPLPSCHSSTPS